MLISFFTIIYILTKAPFLNHDIKNIVNIIFALFSISGMIWVTITFARDNSLVLKIQSLLLLILFILTFSLLPIIVFGEKTIGFINIIFAFSMFFIIVIYSVAVAIRYYKKNMAILFISGLYIFMLFIGSVAFGEFYYNNFSSNFLQYVSAINNTSDIWRQIFIMAKIGIKGFFEFPSQDLLCIISVFQFLIGKVIELILLGYIATQFLNIEKLNIFTSKSKGNSNISEKLMRKVHRVSRTRRRIIRRGIG
ncbi:hypothetical protein AusDCA_2528 [Desulfitobacterium sp. AusDCA]